jgi:microcystin-dependent protein
MSIPANIIVAWSGAINEIPSGWVLCNGSNDTPDLRNRFIIGAEDIYNLNDTGGSANYTLPTHNHTSSNTNTQSNHSHGLTIHTPNDSNSTGSFLNGVFNAPQAASGVTVNAGGAHSHTVTIVEEGEDPTNKNLPPYYALAFIMKEAD